MVFIYIYINGIFIHVCFMISLNNEEIARSIYSNNLLTSARLITSTHNQSRRTCKL